MRIDSGSEITCLSIMYTDDIPHLALGTRDQLVQVWTIESNFQLKVVFVVELPTTIPKVITLIDNAAQDMHVYGILDSQL